MARQLYLTLGAEQAKRPARYADAEVFIRMLRTGKRADGSVIAVMPFDNLSKLDALAWLRSGIASDLEGRLVDDAPLLILFT